MENNTQEVTIESKDLMKWLMAWSEPGATKYTKDGRRVEIRKNYMSIKISVEGEADSIFGIQDYVAAANHFNSIA